MLWRIDTRRSVIIGGMRFYIFSRRLFMRLRAIWNDALVSYKNAYDAYTQDYTRLFEMGPPSQLVGELYHLADSRGRLANLRVCLTE